MKRDLGFHRKRAEEFTARLSLKEKLDIIYGSQKEKARLGVPLIDYSAEAAHGVQARHDQTFDLGEPIATTVFPNPVGMAASFDKNLIHRIGEVVGTESRCLANEGEHNGLGPFAPTVDMERDPRWGRNEEAYGEDPVQVGTMAAAYVKGIQAKDGGHLQCASTLKHFYANNTEIGRGWKNASISPRNKYELYLEPFRRCIEDGKVEGVMTAYNRINGVLGLFNEDVKYLLKNEFGLSHAVSDGGAMEIASNGGGTAVTLTIPDADAN